MTPLTSQLRNEGQVCMVSHIPPKMRRPSHLNALKWGDALDGFLPCRRADCMHADVCREHPVTKKRGFPPYGSDCQIEVLDHKLFVESAKTKFAYALEWLSPDELEVLLKRYSMASIRMRRILMRMTDEGLVYEIKLPNGAVLLRENVGARRYWPTVARELENVLQKLLPPEPDEPDEPLVAPSSLPAGSDASPPECERTVPRPANPTEGWFSLPTRWDHEPGVPETDSAQ